MNYFLTLTFLFAIGSMIGWGIEVVFRRFISQNHWVNPGFLTGPCLPLYGTSLCILYMLAGIEKDISIDVIWIRKLLLFIAMSLAITCLEFFAGLIILKLTNIRLWDYSDRFGNIRGMICPLFTFFWMLLSAIYYFFIHPYILDALEWLARNLAFSFGIGFFYGIFVIDFVYSTHILIKIRTFATEHEIIVRLEKIREEFYHHIKQYKKPNFILSLPKGNAMQVFLEKHIKPKK